MNQNNGNQISSVSQADCHYTFCKLFIILFLSTPRFVSAQTSYFTFSTYAEIDSITKYSQSFIVKLNQNSCLNYLSEIETLENIGSKNNISIIYYLPHTLESEKEVIIESFLQLPPKSTPYSIINNIEFLSDSIKQEIDGATDNWVFFIKKGILAKNFSIYDVNNLKVIPKRKYTILDSVNISEMLPSNSVWLNKMAENKYLINSKGLTRGIYQLDLETNKIKVLVDSGVQNQISKHLYSEIYRKNQDKLQANWKIRSADINKIGRIANFYEFEFHNFGFFHNSILILTTFNYVAVHDIETKEYSIESKMVVLEIEKTGKFIRHYFFALRNTSFSPSPQSSNSKLIINSDSTFILPLIWVGGKYPDPPHALAKFKIDGFRQNITIDRFINILNPKLKNIYMSGYNFMQGYHFSITGGKEFRYLFSVLPFVYSESSKEPVKLKYKSSIFENPKVLQDSIHPRPGIIVFPYFIEFFIQENNKVHLFVKEFGKTYALTCSEDFASQELIDLNFEGHIFHDYRDGIIYSTKRFGKGRAEVWLYKWNLEEVLKK